MFGGHGNSFYSRKICTLQFFSCPAALEKESFGISLLGNALSNNNALFESVPTRPLFLLQVFMIFFYLKKQGLNLPAFSNQLWLLVLLLLCLPFCLNSMQDSESLRIQFLWLFPSLCDCKDLIL